MLNFPLLINTEFKMNDQISIAPKIKQFYGPIKYFLGKAIKYFTKKTPK